MHFSYFLCPAAADPRPAQRADETDDDYQPDRAMDIDEERDFADQGPLTDMDMEDDAEILSLLLKHIPACIVAADIEQLAATGGRGSLCPNETGLGQTHPFEL
jgi:hypothetical protein